MIQTKVTVKRADNQSRDAPSNNICYIFNNSESIFPEGYTPLAQNEQVQKCVYIIANLVSSMTLHLMQNSENGDIRVKNKLSKKMDVNPYSMTTRKNFIHKIVKDMCIGGKSFVLPDIESDGFINDLIPLPRAQCFLRNKTLTHYQVQYGSQIFEPDEILLFTLNPDETFPYDGRGFTPMVKDAVATYIQANATKKAFLKSKWKPSLIISTASDASEVADSEQREKLLKSYTATNEEGDPWIIPAGEIDLKTIQPLTLNDLAVPDSLKLDAQLIASGFGVPAFLVGVGDFDKEEYNNFISGPIMTIAMSIQQVLTKGTLLSPDLYWRFNSRSLMQYNLAEKTTFVKEMVNSAMLHRNEGRDEFGYSPSDAPGMNEFSTLENYIPVDKIGKQKKLNGGEETGKEEN